MKLVYALIDLEVSGSTKITLHTLSEPRLRPIRHRLNLKIVIRYQQLLRYMPSHIAVIVVFMVLAQLGWRQLVQLFLDRFYMNVLVILGESVLVFKFYLGHVQFVNNVLGRVWVE